MPRASFSKIVIYNYNLVDSVVEWLKRRDCTRHGLGSKSTRTILLCPWERHFTVLSAACGSRSG